jgi:cytochrome P450
MTITAPSVSVPVAPGRLPLAGHAFALQRDPLGFLSSLTRLGGVVRIHLGPLPVHVVTRPELVHQMLVTDVASFEKGRLNDKARPFLGNGIMTSGGDLHRRQRRLMQPAFHREMISGYVAVMNDKARALAASWSPGQVVDLQEALDELALRVVASTLFGSELGRRAVAEIQASLPVVARGATIRTLSPAGWLARIPTPGNRRFNAANAGIRTVIDDVIAGYRAGGADHGDLLSMVLAARDADGQGMTDVQARDELVTLLLTGAETAASALGSAFHELGRHPDLQARVRAELRQELAGGPAGPGDIPRLGYTRRVLTETLRLHNPAWILMRRATTRVTLGGASLPAGTELLFSIPALHRDPVLYPSPAAFDPDRWLRRPVKDLPRGAYLPFGVGSRQCIGNSYAWA